MLIYIQDFPGGPGVDSALPNAGGTGSIPGWGTRILDATWYGKKNFLINKNNKTTIFQEDNYHTA